MKKTKAEFLEKIEVENFGQQRQAIVLTHIQTLIRFFLLAFPISHERRRPLYTRMLKFNKENTSVILLFRGFNNSRVAGRSTRL